MDNLEDEDSQIDDITEGDKVHAMHRLQHHATVGRLSVDHGILTVVISPERNISFHGDGLALHEILGAIEFIKLRVQKAVWEMGEETPPDNIDWELVSGGKPS